MRLNFKSNVCLSRFRESEIKTKSEIQIANGTTKNNFAQ